MEAWTKLRSLVRSGWRALRRHASAGGGWSLLGAGITTAAWLLLWELPKREVEPWRPQLDAKEELAAEDNVRRTLAQVVGGAFLLLGLYFTYQNVQIAREGKITDRFSRAIDQLGGQQLEARLGGIYALERIDGDSRKDHWTIVEVLCAFVRERAREGPKFQSSGGKPDGWPPTDVQAACTVLGRRSWRDTERDGQRLDLRLAHLERTILWGAHLEGAILWRAHLQEAYLHGARLEDAKLFLAHLETANLRGAHLEGAGLDQAYLEEVHLNEAHLQRASLVGASLQRAELCLAHLEGADLREAHLEGANLYGAHLERTMLWGAHLEGADLRDANGLTADQVRKAHLDSDTKLPPDIAEALGPKDSVPA